MRPQRGNTNSRQSKSLRQEAPPVGHHLATDTCQTDSDLARIVDVWPTLPDAIKAGILALIKAASGGR
jgi:hypothetical protein